MLSGDTQVIFQFIKYEKFNFRERNKERHLLFDHVYFVNDNDKMFN